jgi:GH3 auxin-responsive promoter
MLQSVLYRTLNSLQLAGCRQAARKFEQALANPEDTQRAILTRLLKDNANSAFGQVHGFESIRSVREYQQSVPPASYDDLAPWINRIKAGEGNVLTCEPVLMFEKSSGSASAAKYIPYTRTLRAQFHAALAPWITDIYRSFPGLSRGCAYWLVTPLSRHREITGGGIPVGFESDSQYFGALSQWLLRNTMAVPSRLARVAGLENCLYLTLRFLLQARSLSFISVWHPSFLLILLNKLEQYGDRLVCDLLSGRVDVPGPTFLAPTSLRADVQQADKLRFMLRRGRVEPGVLWPKLRLISCWTSAESAAVASEVQQRFVRVAIQGKGLLATEGVVSIPSERYGGCVAAVASHFLEFLDEDAGDYRLVSELLEGREYSVLLTTGGGLWRYKLGDRVRVTGFAKRTPILEFVGKDDYVCDIRGEKLNAIFVARILSEFESCRSACFAMLAPSDAVVPRYVLFLENPICESDLASQLDTRLQMNPHYAYCRAIGQLGDPQVFRIQNGAREAYLQHCASLGHRAGAVKFTPLHKLTGWERVFTGGYVQARCRAKVYA